MSESCLHRWLQAADVKDAVSVPGLTQAESAETWELKKRVPVLKQENEILRRATAFFVRDVLPK